MAVRKAVANESPVMFAQLRKSKLFIPLLVLVIAGILFLLKGLFVAALVNGAPITRLSLVQELERKYGKQTLTSMTTELLVLQEGRKKNIKITKAEIDSAVQEVEKNVSKEGGKLDDILALQGLTRESFRKQIEIQKIVEKIFESQIKITEKEIDEYIEKNADSLPVDMKPEEIRVSVKRQLEQQALSSKIQPWLTDLQKKAKIQYFVNF